MVRQPRYSKQEFARLGDEISERDIRPVVERDHQGKIVAIDIETGEWEMVRLSPTGLESFAVVSRGD